MLPLRRGSKHSLAIAMTGVALGDRLLVVGCSDASLLAAITAKVGLSGRACAVVSNEAEAARARRGAEQGGVLLEIETGALQSFPFEEGAFNLVVVDNQDGILSNMRPEERSASVGQIFRVLAPRGRVVVIERHGRGGLAGLLKGRAPEPNPEYGSSGGALAVLQGQGFKAARLLAERDGLSFFEGVR